MFITVSYGVDTEHYHAADKHHSISLVTTEYRHGDEILSHLQMGKNLGIRLGNSLEDLLKGKAIPEEQFFRCTTGKDGKPVAISRESFLALRNRFDPTKTEIERETVEEYSYKDKEGLSSQVQIILREKGGTLTAVIDFASPEQCERFLVPDWLIKV